MEPSPGKPRRQGVAATGRSLYTLCGPGVLGVGQHGSLSTRPEKTRGNTRVTDFTQAQIKQAVQTGAYKRLPTDTLEWYLGACVSSRPGNDAEAQELTKLQAALRDELTRRDTRSERTINYVAGWIGAIAAIVALLAIVFRHH